MQRRDIFAFPSPPLREEDLSSLKSRTCKFIKVFCFCRQKNFSYSTNFPVLTSEELQEKLNNNQKKRLDKYGANSIRYRISDTKHTMTKEESSKPLLIVMPPIMEADVPFGSCREGELFFSYSDQSALSLQLVFFPDLFDVNHVIPRKKRQCVDNWHIKKIAPLVQCCEVISATVVSFPGIKLVPSSASEYKITGMKVECVSASKGNSWGVFFSPEKEKPLSASSSRSTESINSPERNLDSPGPSSGLGYSEPAASLSQSTVTVSVSPERQGKQTQKRRRSPLPESSGVSFCTYAPLPFCGGRSPIIPHSQAAATVSVPPKRQGKQTQKRRKNPFPGSSEIGRRKVTASLAQPRSTVFASLERERQHTQQRGKISPLSEISEVNVRPYPYGPLTFYGDRFSIIPHSQAAATVSVPPDRQGQQIQQRSRSPLSDISGIRHQVICPIPIRVQAAATVSVPPDRQGQQIEQRRKSHLPDTSGIRHQVICPIPIRVQAAATVFVPVEQTQHTQQRRSSPVPGPSGFSFYPYPQYGPWPFSEGSYPYSYPGTGSFVEGFYHYGSPLLPYPHPSVTQDQWMPVFPSSASAVIPLVAVFETLRYDVSGQEGVGQSGRAEVPVGAVQQTPIWRPYEESSSASVPSQAQAENSSEEAD